MKTYTICFVIGLILSNLNTFATTYYATRNGDWSENLWSTESKKGIPETEIPSQSDTIYIDFEINLDVGIVIHSTGKIVINSLGSLTSNTNSLEIKNGGALEVYGLLQVYDLTLNNSSNIIIAADVHVLVYNDFTNKNNTDGVVFDGILDVMGAFYNGNGSVIGGCGKISVAGYYYNWGTTYNTSGQEGNGPFVINCLEALPINLIDYKIKCTKTGSVLEWSTASETNNDYFSIEKSTDMKSWKIVTTLIGEINSKNLKNYSFTDSESNDVNTYYRITQTDLDGKYVSFDMLSILCKLVNNKLDFIGVNASERKINLIVTTDGLNPVTLTVTDMNGNNKIVKEIYPVKGANIIQLDSPNQVGLYVVNMIQNEKSYSKRLYIN